MDNADSVLQNLIRAGNISAFENLFTTHYPGLCLYAKKIMGGDLEPAKDIVQGVFVAVYENRSELQINTSFKSYLYKAVYHACLNYLKQTSLHLTHHEMIKWQAPLADESDTMIRIELEEKIQAVIKKLPEQCRHIFVMNRLEGKKNKEIAEQLSISIRTVETQISKALKILRNNLSDFLLVALLCQNF